MGKGGKKITASKDKIQERQLEKHVRAGLKADRDAKGRRQRDDDDDDEDGAGFANQLMVSTRTCLLTAIDSWC